MKAGKIHLSGLNGLRAIAASAVVVSHTTLSLTDFGLSSDIFGIDSAGNPIGLNLAGYGVTLFFTLSGFLITYLLLIEKETGRINIRKFYIRRMLRIWPLYFMYIAITLIVSLFYNIHVEYSYLGWYVFLSANFATIFDQTIVFLEHYWSLGVEEQFYLFFPFLLLVANKKTIRIFLFLISLFLLVRFIFWNLNQQTHNSLPYDILDINSFQIMLIGAAGAFLYYNMNGVFLRIFTFQPVQLSAWAILLLAAINHFHIYSFIDDEIISMATLVLIIGQITRKNMFISLENKVCDTLGKLSYGIYVIHPLVIFFASKLIYGFTNNGIAEYILVYMTVYTLTILCAFLSYTFIESYFLKLKSKFAVVKNESEMP